jgi:branched-chain amino acid aminotransferase
MHDIKPMIRKTQSPKVKPLSSDLGFGRHFSDHMFVAKYSASKGWHQSQIQPYEPFQIDPGASVLHYGQSLFEGMKAFRQENGHCVLFRPEFNWERMKAGAERLCMEAPPKELFMSGIKELVKVDMDWIPEAKGSSLYIRPTLIGTEAFLGVRPAEEFTFFVILSPVGSYYSGGLAPVKIWVEENYLRAAPGGLGATKAAANYAGSLKAALEAKKKGYTQVLWLDVTRKYIEEVGTMNVFFVFQDEIVTPSLDGTILPGGVRDCLITLLKSWNKKVVERKITLKEIQEAAQNGTLKEAFGSGTAAVVTPIGELANEKWKITLNQNKIGPIAEKLYKDLTDIQYGITPDKNNWTQEI